MTEPLKKVGPYRLWRCIGSGATSEVFEATKEGDHQKYAIKMIRLGKITENQKSMIIKQISLIKSISHPHIVRLHDSLQTTNNFYLVFEYCEKGDLEKYLKKYYGPLVPEEVVQKIIFCIGDAVRQMHSKGIVHRDIKLANILLKKEINNLVIKLADFGFAKEINEEEFMLKTYCGTPITMAPQILQNEYYDKKCDVWSMGIIIFQLVYGKLPFPINEGYNKFVQRVCKQPLKIPSQPKMPQEFKDLLTKCLSKKPQKRYSIEEFMNSEWILQGKDKKLDEKKQQFEAELTKIVQEISNQEVQKNAQLQQLQRNQIIEINTAEKLYKMLKNEVEKIIQNHLETREEIYDRIQSVLDSNQVSSTILIEYSKMNKLLYFLDFKYLNFLRDMSIFITRNSAQVAVKLQDIKNLQMPIFMYAEKAKQQQNNLPESIIVGQTIANFLTKSSQEEEDTLQKRRERYLIVERFLSMLRRYKLTVEITFTHHEHRQQISLQNVLKQFKQMGRHVSESEIQQQAQNNLKQMQGKEEKQAKYDRLSNFITLSIQCKEKDEKLKEYRENLKLTCQKAIDEISKAIQGYYN